MIFMKEILYILIILKNMDIKYGYMGIGYHLILINLPLAFIFIIINFIFFPSLIFRGFIFMTAGLILIIAGFFIVIFSLKSLLNGIKNNKLVRDGLYKYVRHPLYVGWIFFIIPGIILLLGLDLFSMIFFTSIISLKFLIKREEKSLEQQFGSEYAKYKKEVNAFIPKIKFERKK